MQVRVTPELPARLVYYAARDYAQQLSRGEPFDALTPTISVVWLERPLWPHSRRFHRVFELRERDSGELFSDQLVLHVLQLKDWRDAPSGLSPSGTCLQRWARFLSVEAVDQLTALVQEDPIMARAVQSLERISQDPEAARLAREREDSAKFYQIGLAMSRREGRQEGLEEGRQEGLEEGLQEGRQEGERNGLCQSVRQLCQVFGVAISTENEASLNAVSSAELRTLLEHVARHRAWPNS